MDLLDPRQMCSDNYQPSGLEAVCPVLAALEKVCSLHLVVPGTRAALCLVAVLSGATMGPAVAAAV
jgi:hypothetical protein